MLERRPADLLQLHIVFTEPLKLQQSGRNLLCHVSRRTEHCPQLHSEGRRRLRLAQELPDTAAKKGGESNELTRLDTPAHLFR